jgi:hypothetical protein
MLPVDEHMAVDGERPGHRGDGGDMNASFPRSAPPAARTTVVPELGALGGRRRE